MTVVDLEFCFWVGGFTTQIFENGSINPDSRPMAGVDPCGPPLKLPLESDGDRDRYGET